MRIILILTMVGVLTSCSSILSVLPSTEDRKVDDWQFEPAEEEEGVIISAFHSSAVMSRASIGLSAGGAKDINNFRENIKKNSLPLPSDITYEGLFYDYFFVTGEEESCDQIFCPSYASALSKDPFSEQEEYFLSVGLNSGVKQENFSRKQLHLVIVLDISGSMSSSFDRHYYDRFNRGVQVEKSDEDWEKTKLEAATESVVALLDHLAPKDSLGVVLFDDESYLAKPLRVVEGTNIEAIKGHVLELQPQGGTNMSAGLKMAGDLLKEYSSGSDAEVEKRIIFLTDAQPNVGELSEGGITDLATSYVEAGIYTTFIGIGVDFNTELTELIGTIRGANYYAVHSPEEFIKRMDTNFDYMVTPLVFDLQLTVEAPGFEIQKVYGSPSADEATGEIMKLNTLFPSDREEGETRGGLVLLHLKRLPNSNVNSLKLHISYKDRSGQSSSHSRDFEFPDTRQEYYDNQGIRKGIVLSRYVTFMKNWLIYERTKPSLSTLPLPAPMVQKYQREGIFFAFDIEFQPGPWERESQELSVSEEYRNLFQQFLPYFEGEIEAVGDEAMEREKDILKKLIDYKGGDIKF